MSDANRDQNHIPVALGQSSTSATTTLPFKIDSATGRLLVDSASGSGSVTSVSVVSANGFAGTVATATTTPAITISTTINSPVLSGNGTAIAAATTTGTGSTVVLQGSPTLTTAILGSSTATTQSPGDNSTKVATTAYVDNAVLTTNYKEACKYGSVAALPTIVYANGASGVGATITGFAFGALSLDGASPSVGDRVLIKNQVSDFQNGIYTVTATGSAGAFLILTRATDFDQSSDIKTGDTVFITAGNTLANTLWAYTGIDSPTMGTTSLTFVQVSADLIVGQSVILSGTTTRILYDNAGVLGEYTLTGSGTVVAMQTAPTFATSITTPSVLATANDSGALGASGTAFADLFLASGGVINWLAGATTITHSANTLTFGGSAFTTLALGTTNITMTGSLAATGARVTKGWFTDLESTNDITINGTALATTYLAKAGGTLTGSITLGENTGIALDPAGSADGKWSGITITGVAGYAQTYGDLVYLAVADSRWEKTDADALATAGNVMLAMVVVAGGSDGAACTLLLQGQIRADAAFPALTVGAGVFVGETAGAIQVAIPTGADNVIRVVGFALTADEIYFNPSQDWQTTVA